MDSEVPVNLGLYAPLYKRSLRSDLLAWYWLTMPELVAFGLASFTSEERRKLAVLRRRYQWDQRVITNPAERFWRR